MNALRPVGRTVAGLFSVVMLLAACSSGAGAIVAPSPSPSSAPPDAPASAPPNTGAGTDPLPSDPAAAFVVPKPGQLDVHPVPIERLEAQADGQTIIVIATWTSGIEPCYTLDRVVVDPGDDTFTITLLEGHGPGNVACIEIAQQHQTRFEIPTSRSGTYTLIGTGGQAAPIQVTVG